MRPVIFIALIFLSLSARALDLGRLESVELRRDEAGDWLELTTDRPANFTSFKLDAPTRIVVEFPEMTASAIEPQNVTTGLFRRWAPQTWSDAGSPVVRLVVELVDDADYTLLADENRISLRLQPATGRPLVPLDERRPAPGPLPSLVAVSQDENKSAAGEWNGSANRANAVTTPSTRRSGGRRTVGGNDVSGKHQSLHYAEKDSASLPDALSPASLEQIAFRRTDDGARIVLRTSRPVRWALVEKSGQVAWLELEDTQIPAMRNRLPLDTRFFKTAVARVVPSEDAVHGRARAAVELVGPARLTAFGEGADIVLEVSSTLPRAASAGDENW